MRLPGLGGEPGAGREPAPTAKHTGPASAGPGGWANSGVVINIGHRPVAHSVYLRQVQQIFPWELLDRDAELAELTAFCTEPDRGPYVWWQAPLWAGKSALMAWFVLHPPPEVHIVSFFITARFAGQRDRIAFLEIVLEQLAEVTGQPMPNALTESRQQAWFNQLLHDAAVVCAENKQRLVLLVDGLDEDRGVTTAPDVHSIAAMLPAVPPAGVRVIVAGRPDPPVPADVPPRHPLRDKTIVRPLSVSPHAQMIRDDAERELAYLLDDRALGRKLLGLVSTAGGGLSRDDLAELCGESTGTVEKTLRSVLGRTFQGFMNRWQASASPVFALAHENLQQVAIRSFSPNELSGFLDQLHRWADKYRQRYWPVGTPEYLLNGYPRLVISMGDVQRATELATDRIRLDRMLDVSGGDATALAEITAIQERICDNDSPDLAAIINLAVIREDLISRNQRIPLRLPAVWVRLGNPDRAATFARSISGREMRVMALLGVANTLVDEGDLDRARQMTHEAEAVARSKTGPLTLSLLDSVALTMARTGDVDRAEAVARSRSGPGAEWELKVVAETLAKRGDIDRAVAFARLISEPVCRTGALAVVAKVLAGVGDLGQARLLAEQAKTAASSVTNPADRACLCAVLAEAMVRAGDVDQARLLAEQARAAVRSMDEVDIDFFEKEDQARAFFTDEEQAQAVTAAAETFAWAGDLDSAQAIARSVTDLPERAFTFAAVAEVLAAAGDLDQARQVAGQAEAAARSSPAYKSDDVEALTAVAAVLARVGDSDHARELALEAQAAARSRAPLADKGWILAAAAEALARIGDLDQAEATARSLTEPSRQASVLAGIAEVLAGAGDLDQARRFAQAAIRSVANAKGEVSALASVAKALAAAGDLAHARQIAEQARAAAHSSSNPNQWIPVLGTVAEALGAVHIGQMDAYLITDPLERTQALATVAKVLTRAGDLDQACQFAEQAAAAARSITNLQERLFAQAAVSGALVKAGDLDQARHIARQMEITARAVTDPPETSAPDFWSPRARALTTAVKALAQVGDFDRAEAAARTITDPRGQARALTSIVESLAETADPSSTHTTAHEVMDGTGLDINERHVTKNTNAIRIRRLVAIALAQGEHSQDLFSMLAKVEPMALIKAMGLFILSQKALISTTGSRRAFRLLAVRHPELGYLHKEAARSTQESTAPNRQGAAIHDLASSIRYWV